MTVKLQDVAKRAGVTVTTVSRVLNDFPHVSKKTHDKVLKAVNDLHYHPNALARSLQGKSSKFIGLIFPTISNPFFSELVNSLEQKLSGKGYKIIIASSAANTEAERRYLEMLDGNMVEGIITGSHNLGIREYEQVNMPIVSFDRFLSDKIPIISSDNLKGGQLAAEYLLKKGSKNIAIITDNDQSKSPTILRSIGASNTIKKAGAKYQIFDYPDLQFSEQTKYEIFKKIFKDNDFDGIFANNDTTALLAKKAFKENDQKIPNMIGYDGTTFFRRYLDDFATIVQPIDTISDYLIEFLFKRMADPKREFSKMPLIPVKLYQG
ncbi:LacI family transcription regulator [Oenococcus alcoholitolerans]|uniref:LacI family transcription regulator n=1 Tax=Oenococcus alcoholitolerans TaxID=931074 RepID=A0ABR4XRS3_9LACO|nr:LacI family transcription regulator [Oenococcus alcoholitolerans]